ncbi:B-cell receptor CD22 [Halotydeus destructor]|nr:B-cell receptor CD22 [Halotydeus destructor]
MCRKFLVQIKNILLVDISSEELKAIAGGWIVIPCNTYLWKDDAISLILWYKGSSGGAPIYSVDARHVALSAANHSSLDTRMLLETHAHPAQLRISPVMAADQGEYRCRVDYRSARTQNYVTYLTVNDSVPPIKVQLRLPKKPLVAGEAAEFDCMAASLQPDTQLSWYKNHKLLYLVRENNTSSDGNRTISRLSFIPTIEDNGKDLSCQASNEKIPYATVEDTSRLDIHFSPQLTVNLGASIKRESIKEGNDVFLECNVKSNPGIREVLWTFEGRPLQSNLTDGLLVSNQSLVLQQVKKHHRGNYRCIAVNSVGENKSDPFFLRVKFRPSCKVAQRLVYATGTNELVNVLCEVEADPREVRFSWSANVSSQSSEIRSFSSTNLRSVASYVPKNRFGFGSIVCSAENEVGQQLESCVFSVVPAGPPEAVKNCQVTNRSMSTLLVECTAGDASGLTQYFFMEVYDLLLQKLHHNASNEDEPRFFVANLPTAAQLTLVIYATNNRGRSGSVSLTVRTLGPPEKQMSRDIVDQVAFNPLLGLLMATVAVVVLISTIIIIVMRIQANHHDTDQVNGHESRSKSSYKSANGTGRSGDDDQDGGQGGSTGDRKIKTRRRKNSKDSKIKRNSLSMDGNGKDDDLPCLPHAYVHCECSVGSSSSSNNKIGLVTTQEQTNDKPEKLSLEEDSGQYIHTTYYDFAVFNHNIIM